MWYIFDQVRGSYWVEILGKPFKRKGIQLLNEFPLSSFYCSCLHSRAGGEQLPRGHKGKGYPGSAQKVKSLIPDSPLLP